MPSATDLPIAAFGGSLHGGNQPVQGAYIALYATSATGYGTTVKQIGNTTTDGNGNFSFTGGPSCGSGQFVYALATGGNPGLAKNTNNTAILMMSAIGPCSTLGTGTYININEVSTVASAYALSGFLPAGGAGMTYANVISAANMPGVATSANNLQGLTDAFANAANIYNYNTGQAYTTTPTGGTVNSATINAVADILQDCVNSLSGTSASCVSTMSTPNGGSLTQATPPAGSGIATPANSLQAAIDIAQFPGNNVANLFSLISSTAAFPTNLSAATNDLAVGITYTSPLLTSGLSLAVDGADNVYVGGSYQKATASLPLIDADLIEFTAQGGGGTTDQVTPTTLSAATNNVRSIAPDVSGNLYLSDGAATGVYKYVPGNSTPSFLDYSKAPASNADANNYAIALDSFGDVYTTSYKKSTCATGTAICALVEFVAGNATAYQPNATFSGTTISPADTGGARGLAFDTKTGNVWITDITNSVVQRSTLVPTATAVATLTAGPTNIQLGTSAGVPATNNYGAASVAIDASSNAWVTVVGGPVDAATGKVSAAVPAELYQVGSTATTSTGIAGGGLASTTNLPSPNGGGLTTPANVIVDGNGNIFVANTGASTTTSGIVEYSPGFNASAGAFLSPNVGFSPGATYTSGALSGGTVYQAGFLQIDKSGALWVLSGGTGQGASLANLVQILGIAAPTNPVQAVGQYGVKPF